MSGNLNKDKIIEKYEKIQKRDRIQKIILIIIILIILIVWGLSYRIGRIGDIYQETSNNVLGKNEEIKLIKVFDDDVGITKNTELNIFKNKKFKGEKMIAPKSEGEYTFCVKNVTDRDVIYDINFTEEKEYSVNMKYKLKKDNNYIVGNENKYSSLDELNIEDIIVPQNTINVFTLEWYWEDDDKKDTIVATQEKDQYYSLNLEIFAEEYNK